MQETASCLFSAPPIRDVRVYRLHCFLLLMFSPLPLLLLVVFRFCPEKQHFSVPPLTRTRENPSLYKIWNNRDHTFACQSYVLYLSELISWIFEQNMMTIVILLDKYWLANPSYYLPCFASISGKASRGKIWYCCSIGFVQQLPGEIMFWNHENLFFLCWSVDVSTFLDLARFLTEQGLSNVIPTKQYSPQIWSLSSPAAFRNENRSPSSPEKQL